MTDTHVFRAGPESDRWSFGPVYRPPPASKPQARIPSGPAARAYDIGYFARDVRRAAHADLPVEISFSPAAQSALLPREVTLPSTIDVPVMKPIDGTFKNPDVERYDPSGLRSTMTASTVATRRELRRHVEDHVPRPAWARPLTSSETATWQAAQAAAGLPPTPGVPRAKRISPWQVCSAMRLAVWSHCIQGVAGCTATRHLRPHLRGPCLATDYTTATLTQRCYPNPAVHTRKHVVDDPPRHR